MYKIESVKIVGFWHRFDAECVFRNDTNIIVGRNGSGKTTFMNILHSVLTADVEGIGASDFDSIEIKLVSGKRRRTVVGKKIFDDRYPFPIFEYQISQRKYPLRLISNEDGRIAMSHRRRVMEYSLEVRRALSEIASVSSLSVYRLRRDDDYEVRDRHGSRILSPVDYRLAEGLKGLTQYQLELSQRARLVSTNLQKEVLASILYSKEDSDEPKYQMSFDKDEEKSNLTAAYSQLSAIDSNVRKRIDFHVNAIDQTIRALNLAAKTKGEKLRRDIAVDFRSLEALNQTRKVIEMSLKAETETNKIFAQLNLFLRTISSFVSDKQFSFESGSLLISNKQGEINHVGLSSGEKQLLILLIEALLQREKPHIFLADEPELSLHIEWQRNIIPAIRDLNPNAQVIVATHSPEVASKYREAIFDMEALISG